MRINGNHVLIIGSTEAKTQPKWCAKWRLSRQQKDASFSKHQI